MEDEQKIKVALVRGDSLNEWEGKLWENLGSNFLVQGFCARKNLYNTGSLIFPVERLSCSSDNFLVRNFNKYVKGIFQKMNGLDQKLEKFDIVHTAELSYFFTNQSVRSKKLNPKLKVVTTVWDNSFGRFEYNYWYGLKIAPLFWRKKIDSIIKENIEGVDMFLPVTDYSAQMLLDYGVNENKIRILTPAVIMPSSSSLPNILSSLNLSGNFFMSVCRMVKEKGVYDILYAWRMYIRKTQQKDCKLLFIGNGRERDNMIRLVRDFNLESSVVFVQSMPNKEVRSLCQYAKGLILASLPGFLWQEQFGYVLAEAISSECPVISTYSGAIPEVVEDAGLLFSPGNPVDLRDCLIKLENPNVYKELKNNCSRVKNKFVVENFRNNLVSIYKELYD